MARYRNYSDDDKAQALAFLAAHRNNYRVASKTLNIPWQTLQNWHRNSIGVNQAVTQIEPQKRGDLAEALTDKIWLMVNVGITEDKVAEAQLSQVTTGIGTLIDKVRLLQDQPTEIHGDDTNERRIVIRYDEQEPSTDADPASAPPAPRTAPTD